MYFRGNKKTAQNVFISDPIDTDKDGNTLTLQDIIADERCIIDSVDTKIKSEKLLQYMGESLDERARTILTLRYGLGGCEELTQREVAKKLNISRSYVSRIEKRALSVLRGRFSD